MEETNNFGNIESVEKVQNTPYVEVVENSVKVDNVANVNARRQLKFCEALREATDQCMEEDESVFIIGEGVPDPKGIFGTTKGLQEKYGKKRVMDMPLSENALTGVCVGAAINGMRPILTHQRLDFTLLSFDQIINIAAKWHYMFGGQFKVPLVIRMIIGRGWGQGAQHSQNLQALFAHIPGLKVVMPTTAHDAKGLLIASIKDNNPVMFIEHRWLFNLVDYVPEEKYTIPIGVGKVVREGTDLTIAATSYMVVEAIKTADYLKEKGISVEVIDIRTLRPFDDSLIIQSVKKTGKLLVADTGYYTGGFAGEVVSRVSEKAFSSLTVPPQRITLPDIPTPTSPGLTKYYYPHYQEMIRKVLSMLGREDITLFFQDETIPLDVPDKSFTGPF